MTATKAIAIAFLALLGMDALSADARVTKRKEPDPAPRIQPDESTAVVSFIRRSVFAGDGQSYFVWDGEHYIGELNAGKLLQYRAAPGEHTFLLMQPGIQIWSFMKADLVAGKEYFSRAHPIPFSLQPADANSDERIDEWSTMVIGPPLTEKQRAKQSSKTLSNAQGALAALKSGVVTTDCGLWYPPRNGKQRKQPSSKGGACRSLGVMKPEFGR